MDWKKVMVYCLILLLALGTVGCSQGEPEKEAEETQVIRYNLGTEPETLDPAKMTGMIEGTIANAVFEGLVRYDAQSRPKPGIAKDWTISDNGLVYTFRLRDAMWSNGDPVTAEDFRYAWLRALNPDLAYDYAYQLYYIKGAQEYNSGKGSAEDVAIKVSDPKTLEVTLKAPAPQFLGLTAFETLMPVNRKTDEAFPDWFSSPENYVSNGPFKLESWEHKQKITLVKNPAYWDAANVKLDRLEIFLLEDVNTAFAMYSAGQIDFVERTPTQEIARKKNDSDFHLFPDSSTYFYRFNTTRKPLDDPRVRKALAMAIDRSAIVNSITQTGEKPAFAYVPYGFTYGDGIDFREEGGNSYFEENVALAQELLAQAGYPGGKGFPKISIMLNKNELHQKIAEVIQEMWRQNLGIEIGISMKEWKAYLTDQAELNYDIARGGWGPDYLDPMTFMDVFLTDGGNNNTGWSKRQYDSLIGTANSTGDNVVRMKAMHEAEAILMESMPVMPIYFYTNDNLIRENIKGIVVPPFSIYAEFKWAYVE